MISAIILLAAFLASSVMTNVWLIFVIRRVAEHSEKLEKANARSLAEDAETDALISFLGNHFGAPRMGGSAPILNRMGTLRWLFEHLKKQGSDKGSGK